MTVDYKMGMFIGLAIGDALGAPLEFQEAREPDNYLTQFTTGGVHNVSVGEWTDDTSMALAMATSLIEKGKFDVCHPILRRGLILPEPRELLQWPHERDAPHSSQGRPHRIRLHRHRPGRLGDYPFGFETALSSRPTAGRRSHQRWSRL